MTDATTDLIQIIETQQKMINHLSKAIGSIGTSQWARKKGTSYILFVKRKSKKK